MRTAAIVFACCVAAATVAAGQGRNPAAGQTQPAGPVAGQGPGRAGPPPTLVVEVQNMFNTLKGYITKSADQFPEDKYGWSPTPDVRTWGGLLSHIADDNNSACWALAGEAAMPPSLDSGGKPTAAGKDLKKADIVTLLGESFARCDKAFGAVTPDNMMERQGSRSKIGALIYDTQHISEHWGNIVTYMRLQNLVPPSTAARSGRGRGGLYP
jgi:hypothetical protein